MTKSSEVSSLKKLFLFRIVVVVTFQLSWIFFGLIKNGKISIKEN